MNYATGLNMKLNLKPVGQMGRQRGFTFMELMITIAVVAILTTIALPNFTAALQNNRLTGQANEMVTSFQFARSEALKRGIPIEVCASSNGATCAGNWNQGWIAWCPTDADCAGLGENVLRVWPGNGPDFSFTPASGLVQYRPTGFALAAFTVDLTLPNCAGENAREITVEATGRAASRRTTCT